MDFGTPVGYVTDDTFSLDRGLDAWDCGEQWVLRSKEPSSRHRSTRNSRKGQRRLSVQLSIIRTLI